MRGLGDIINGLYVLLPPWALALFGIAALVLFVPGWVDSMRSKQIRSAIRRAAMTEDPNERSTHTHQAWTLAANRSSRLITLAAEAQKRGLNDILDRTVQELIRRPKTADFARMLIKRKQPDRPPPRHPIEEAVNINRLLEEGMVTTAQERLRVALERFPDDPDLVQTQRRLNGGASGDSPGPDQR